MKLTIANNQSEIPVVTAPIRRVAVGAARALERSTPLTLHELSVAIVNDAKIARLNWQFLRHRGPTDVITFDYSVAADGMVGTRGSRVRPLSRTSRRLVPTNGHGRIGEIVISAETAQAQARRYRRSLEEELARYVVHGLLHLAGQDDTTPVQRRQMRRRENELLRSIQTKGK